MREYPAIIAALPREVSALVQGWGVKQLPGNIVVYGNGHAVVACAGMGPARAALAVEAAMAAAPVTRLLSVGLAGACNPLLHAGDIVRAGLVIDSQTGERFEDSHEDSQAPQVLVSTPAIASIREKSRLYASYQASAVDMEAAAIARLARAHNLPFQAMKAISDEANFEVESLSRFATVDGQFREVAFALHAALRPPMWSKLIALARNSNKALAALTAALNTELDWYRDR
jgi:adenosylhomocysteine nucleosidase